MVTAPREKEVEVDKKKYIYTQMTLLVKKIKKKWCSFAILEKKSNPPTGSPACRKIPINR